MKHTKCANLHAVNDLRVEQIILPECQEEEVLVQVKNCGICGSDIPRVYTKGTYHSPTVIGHEFCGKVVFDPKDELVGKKVAVFPLLPCFECASCKSGSYATCENYDYYGSRRNGGMSEYINIKRWNILVMPDDLSYEEGAMCEPVSVARHATCKLGIEEGDNILISGAGPIGIIAGQWAKAFGAKNVYYFDIDDRKIEFANSMGFLEYTKDIRIDCVIEGTGNSNALCKCLDAVKPSGKVVLMGNPAGDVALTQNAYWHILRKELLVFGTWNSFFNDRVNDWKESLNAMSQSVINVKPLITHRFLLKDCNSAFEMMKNKTEFYNKVMLVMNKDGVEND